MKNMQNDLGKIHSQYKDYITDEQTDWKLLKENEQHLIACHQAEDLYTQLQVSHFNEDILLSRTHGVGNGDCIIKAKVENFSHNFTLLINVTGIINITLENGKKITINPDEIWFIRGNWSNFHEERISVNGEISSLHMYFSQKKILKWSHEDLIPTFIFSPDDFDTMQCSNISNRIAQIEEECHRLIYLPYKLDGMSQLEIETATLNLLMSIFRNVVVDRSSQMKADVAIKIILDEYMHKLTIAILAQRIGTNECYLKKVFKERTETTITNYLRQHRLQVAYGMIASGYTIHESMLSVGYHHTGHFNKIFKTQYGFAPIKLRLLTCDNY